MSLKSRAWKWSVFCSVLFSFFSVPHAMSDGQIEMSFQGFPHLGQLPSTSVQRVFQDKEGYMWFGTLDGLCRYDAYQVKSWRSDMNNPSLLTNNEILAIVEDDDDQLWIGTKQGLNILNKKTFQIEPFHESIIQGEEIKSLVYDSDGYLWIGLPNALFKYHTKKKTLQNYSPDEFDKKTIPGYGITSIYKDNNDAIWILFWGSGLCRYNKETDSFDRFPPVGESNIPFRIFQDKSNHYWICTWGNGIYRFNPDAPENEMYTHYEVKKNNSSENESVFFSIVQDDKYGYFWVVSLSGLYVFDYDQTTDKLLPIDISSHLRKTSKLFSEIIKDKDNNLWIGAFSEGVFLIPFEKLAVRNYSLDILEQRLGSSSCICALATDNDGLVWLGLNRIGVCLYDREKGVATLHTELPSMNIPEFAYVSYILNVKSLGECWIATSGSRIYAFKKRGNDISSYSFDIQINDQINSNENKIMFEDRKGRVWIGMQRGVVVRSPGGQLTYVDNIPSVTGISQDSDGVVWVSSEKAGLFKIIEEKSGYRSVGYDKYTEGLNTNNIQTVCGHSKGKVWIGTKEGRVIAYDKQKNKFEDYSTICAMTGGAILNILEDSVGSLWISTKKRVTQFNPSSNTSTYYTVFDGLSVNSFVAGGATSLTGEVLFGGNKGFCSFYSNQNKGKQKLNPRHVYITDIRVQNHSVYEKKTSTSFDNKTNRLVIGQADKNIEIEFSALNYTSPSRIQYAYMLEGVDKSWTLIRNDRRLISYNNLGTGKYNLLLKSTDENGIWTDKITSLEIVKSPAFYETWWAYIIYVALILSILGIVNRILINRLNLTNKLKIIQIEKEKSEELTQEKLKYFTNISHELLTPLTIVSCLIEDVESSYKGKFWQHEVMRSNIGRLKRLLQQILDFRKVESGNLKLKVSEGDAVAFIKHICDFNFTPLEKEKEIQLVFSASDEHLFAWFDHDKIDKIIFNLLSNAFKYTGRGGEIRLHMERTVKNETSYIRIIVSDTGKGIAEDEIEKIFTRFYSNAPSTSIENHGVGLALTKDLLELHHGSISVQSELGKGTTFFLEVPADREAYLPQEIVEMNDAPAHNDASDLFYVEQDISEEEEAGGTDSLAEREDVRILLVEDNVQLRSLIAKIMSKKYEVLEAGNGIEALKIVEDTSVDIVISDIMMPEMDGIELCKALKREVSTSHIEVLLLTAKNSIDDRIECYDAGADGYISKPFELKVLMAKMNSLVRNRKHRVADFMANLDSNISSLKYTSLDEKFIKDAVAVIEKHLGESEFDLEVFASELNISKSSLYRKLKALTSLSPVEFIRDTRLKHGYQMLKSQMGNISDIAYATGFSDPKYFTACFKARYEMTPTDFIKKCREEQLPD